VCAHPHPHKTPHAPTRTRTRPPTPPGNGARGRGPPGGAEGLRLRTVCRVFVRSTAFRCALRPGHTRTSPPLPPYCCPYPSPYCTLLSAARAARPRPRRAAGRCRGAEGRGGRAQLREELWECQADVDARSALHAARVAEVTPPLPTVPHTRLPTVLPLSTQRGLRRCACPAGAAPSPLLSPSLRTNMPPAQEAYSAACRGRPAGRVCLAWRGGAGA